MHKNFEEKKYLFIIIAIILFGAISYGGYSFWQLHLENISQKNRITELNNSLKNTGEQLARSEAQNTTLTEELNAEVIKTNDFAQKISQVSGEVSTLVKLSKTDPELLKKYSKIYFLNENYLPPRLKEIDSQYLFYPKEQTYIETDVWPHLQNLLDKSVQDNSPLLVISAYRSFNTQSDLKSNYKVIYGAGSANQFSADQGYSEHQLGTALDFTTKSVGGTFTKFEDTPQYKWLTDNAYKYGFVISYPKSNKYYVYEPWHWRFVGVELATMLHNENKYFYDLDQRQIDQYLVKIFD